VIPERMFALFAVWSLVLSSLTQGLIHLTTWWMLRRQRNAGRLGFELTRAELWLGIKTLVRAVFDILLAVVVTWQVYILNGTERIVLYIAVGLVTYITIYFRLRFLSEIRRESWGGNEEVNERQDLREVEQNTRETFQTERADEIARRQQDREDKLDERQADLNDKVEAAAERIEHVADDLAEKGDTT
jgi:hypothetical protein